MPVNATNTPSKHRAELTAWANENIPEVSGVYLLHFEAPVGHGTRGEAEHYLGSASNIRARFLQHLGGCGAGGARLTEVCNEKGIRFHMTKVYQTETTEKARLYEAYFKKCAKNSKRCCPYCGGKDWPSPSK